MTRPSRAKILFDCCGWRPARRSFAQLMVAFCGRGWRIRLTPWLHSKIGIVKLERHRVEIEFDGLTAEEQDRFMRLLRCTTSVAVVEPIRRDKAAARVGAGDALVWRRKLLKFFCGGSPALRGGESGQVRKEAATPFSASAGARLAAPHPGRRVRAISLTSPCLCHIRLTAIAEMRFAMRHSRQEQHHDS